MRTHFDSALQQVEDKLISLGSMVESGLIEAVTILDRRDKDGARRLIQWDEWVNAKRFEIEEDTLILIARQQPVAIDMRFLASILDINSELERVGDYAKGIAKINLLLADDFPHKPFMPILKEMAENAAEMIREALIAFNSQDVEYAKQVTAMDQRVDTGYRQLYRALMAEVIRQPNELDAINNLMWAGHNLERAGDRAVNICERAIFTATGDMKELNSAG